MWVLNRIYLRKDWFCYLGVNFINILQAAFWHLDPKNAKKTDNLTGFFTLLGSASVKAACRKLMKLTPKSLFIDCHKYTTYRHWWRHTSVFESHHSSQFSPSKNMTHKYLKCYFFNKEFKFQASYFLSIFICKKVLLANYIIRGLRINL